MQESIFEEEAITGLFRNRLLAVPRETLAKTVGSCRTYISVVRRLGISRTLFTAERRWLESRLDFEGINHDHLAAAFAQRGRKAKSRVPAYINMTNEEVISTYFTEGSPYSWFTIKRLIVDRKLLPHNCSECGLGPEWNGTPLTLQHDHINGINTDHRLENLRTICPNCHSQTDTYGGKNNQKIDWASFVAKKKFDIPPVDGG